MPKVLSLKQLMNKNYTTMTNVPDKFRDSFGEVVGNFKMIIWGPSGNGKTNLIMQLIKVLISFGKVLYVSLEEGHERTMQTKASEYFTSDEDNGKIRFADHTMGYEELVKVLSRKQSPKFIVIDSLQYWNISYDQYKELKSKFPRKGFIFISHASGKEVDGKTGTKIRYDAGIKVRVEGFVAFVASRYGGNQPYVIWEDGARRYWGKKYKSTVEGIKRKPKNTEA